jgi:hypothetical protein
MPDFARNVEIRNNADGTRHLFVDGNEFPWYTNGINRTGNHMITVAIPAASITEIPYTPSEEARAEQAARTEQIAEDLQAGRTVPIEDAVADVQRRRASLFQQGKPEREQSDAERVRRLFQQGKPEWVRRGEIAQGLTDDEVRELRGEEPPERESE